jgi:hypothetical protein
VGVVSETDRAVWDPVRLAHNPEVACQDGDGLVG